MIAGDVSDAILSGVSESVADLGVLSCQEPPYDDISTIISSH